MARVTSSARKVQTDKLEMSGDALPAQGLVRGLQVLRAFTPDDGMLRHSEIVTRTGLPNATVSRLTQTLTALGYLSYIAKVGRYTLGPAIASLCHNLMIGMPYRVTAKPVMHKLADLFRLPISLASRDGLDMINIETVRHAKGPSVRFDIGARIPIASTATGRAYIFGLPSNEQELIVDALLRESKPAERQIIQRRIDQAFAELSELGFCTCLGEWRPDVWGVAASIVTEEGVALAINCGGHPKTVSAVTLKKSIGPKIASAAAEITRLIRER